MRHQENAAKRPSNKTQYRTIDTSTLKGLREAERLKAAGWTIAYTGLFLIWFYKKGGNQ